MQTHNRSWFGDMSQCHIALTMLTWWDIASLQNFVRVTCPISSTSWTLCKMFVACSKGIRTHAHIRAYPPLQFLCMYTLWFCSCYMSPSMYRAWYFVIAICCCNMSLRHVCRVSALYVYSLSCQFSETRKSSNCVGHLFLITDFTLPRLCMYIV